MILRYSSVAEPTEEQSRIITSGLRQYNSQFVGDYQAVPLSIVVTDESGEGSAGVVADVVAGVVAGIEASMCWGWCYISHLWVSDALRGHGVGASLLSRLEQHCKSEGVNKFRLETTDFQALGFYKKQGFSVFAELEDFPPGYTCYYLKITV